MVTAFQGSFVFFRANTALQIAVNRPETVPVLTYR